MRLNELKWAEQRLTRCPCFYLSCTFGVGCELTALVRATIREWRKLFGEPPPVFTEAKLGHFVQALKSSQSEQLLNAQARPERRSLRDKKKRETYVGIRFDLKFVTEDRMRRIKCTRDRNRGSPAALSFPHPRCKRTLACVAVGNSA
jgi:hypothetical protein